MIKVVKIRNRKTGNIRVIDYHVQDESDDPMIKSFHARHPPTIHVDLSLGPDEEVIA